MSQSDSIDSGATHRAKLPRRDWILLPLVGLFTIVVLSFSTEWILRWQFPSFVEGLDGCFGKDRLAAMAHANPNSVCRERIPESRQVAEYRFNDCGDRTGLQCGPRKPGSYRIVMMGSSFAMGLFVPQESTFAALLPEELSRETGRKVELYNKSKGGEYRGGPFPTASSVRNFNDILSAKPDMILWVMTSMDMRNATMEDTPAATASSSLPQGSETVSPAPTRTTLASVWDSLKMSVNDGNFAEKLRFHWQKTTSSLVLNHFLLEIKSQNQYVASYLENEDDAGFLRSEPDAKWRSALVNFDTDAAGFESQARAAGVPLVAVLVPNRAQTAMVSMGDWPVGYDPFKLDRELRAIVERHGGTFIDILPELRRIPNPEQHYFPVDGHLDAAGHAMIARLLAAQLTAGAVPELRVDPKPTSAWDSGR